MFYDTDKYDLLPFYSSCAILIKVLEGEMAMGSNKIKVDPKVAGGWLTLFVIPAAGAVYKGYHAYRQRTVSIPNFCDKEFPVSIEQAVDTFKSLKLKPIAVRAGLKDANPIYKDCNENQIIAIDPRPKRRVEIGSTVLVKYITQEVINESKRLYEKQKALAIRAKLEEDLKSPLKIDRIMAQKKLDEMRTTK